MPYEVIRSEPVALWVTLIRPDCPATIFVGFAKVQGHEAWTRVILWLLLDARLGVNVDVEIETVAGDIACPADHVFAAFKSGIVAPLVPVAVEQPVAPLERPEQGMLDAVTLDASVAPVNPEAGTAVAVIVPLPDAARDPPVPITSAAVVFVPPTIFAQR